MLFFPSAVETFYKRRHFFILFLPDCSEPITEHLNIYETGTWPQILLFFSIIPHSTFYLSLSPSPISFLNLLSFYPLLFWLQENLRQQYNEVSWGRKDQAILSTYVKIFVLCRPASMGPLISLCLGPWTINILQEARHMSNKRSITSSLQSRASITRNSTNFNEGSSLKSP